MTAQRAKLFRDLWLYKGRTLLVVLAITVGVAAFGVMSYAQVALETNIRETFLATDPASGILYTADFGPDDSLFDVARQVEGVADVNARRVIVVKIQADPGEWKTVELHMIPDFDGLSIGRLVYEPGAQVPPPEGTLLLERSALAMFDVSVGDSLHVRLPGGEVAQMSIAGLANDLGLMPSSAIPIGYAFVTSQTIAALDISEATPLSFNRLYIRVEHHLTTRPEVEAVIAQVVEQVQAAGVTVQRSMVPNPWETPLESSANTALLLLASLGLLSLGLSAFLVTNIMAAVVTEHIKQIGVIKSLGGKVSQIIALYLQMVLVYGLLALVVAIPAALIGAYFLADFSAQQLDVDIVRFGVPPNVLMLQIISGVLVPLAAALIPILSGVRITIREAISSYGVAATGGGLLGRLSGLPAMLAMSIRNIFRRKMRVVLTLAALSLAGGTFIAVLGVRHGMYHAIDVSQREWDYDVAVDLAAMVPTDQLVNAIFDMPDIEIETWLLVDARRIFEDRVGGSFTLIGLPADSTMVRPGIRAGRWLEPEEGGQLFLSGETYDMIQQPSVGGQVTLRVLGADLSWDLVGVSTTRFVMLAYTDYESVADLIARAHGIDGLANRLVVRGTDGSAVSRTISLVAEQSRLERDILDRLDRARLEVVRSETTTENRLMAEAQIANLVMLLLVSAGLTAIVGGLGLASAMGLNVLDRTREIGVLRSLGAKGHVIQRMVMAESVVIGGVSYLPGIALSLPLTHWLNIRLGAELFQSPLDYFFAWEGALLWGGVLLVVSVVASYLPAHHAANLTIRDTLAFEG
jgi:putative ABC transport system permease protein